MAKDQLTGKAYLTGNLVSHSNKKSKTRRHLNIRSKRIWDTENGRWIRLTISARTPRTLSRKGWDAIKGDL